MPHCLVLVFIIGRFCWSFANTRVPLVTEYPTPEVPGGHSPSQFEEINRLLEETDWRGEAEWNRALEVLNEHEI